MTSRAIALLEILQDGNKFILENFLFERYLLQDGRKIQGKPRYEGDESKHLPLSEPLQITITELEATKGVAKTEN